MQGAVFASHDFFEATAYTKRAGRASPLLLDLVQIVLSNDQTAASSTAPMAELYFRAAWAMR